MGNLNEEGFDKSEDGQSMVALLQRYAPPPIDSRRGAQAVLARIEPHERGRLLRWLGPALAAAAALVVTVMVLNPPESTPENVPVADLPAPPPVTVAEIRRDREYPEIVAHMRGSGLIDAGLKDGLRVGDELTGPGGIKCRVTAAGVFEARISADSPISRGAELRARVSTEAQKRAARFADFGGDPGAFFEFGVLLGALPAADARMLGIADGQALRVDEIVGTMLRSGAVEPTLASRLDLRTSDVIVEVNGASVRTVNDFAESLGWSLSPERLTVRILRNGKQLDLKL